MMSRILYVMHNVLMWRRFCIAGAQTRTVEIRSCCITEPKCEMVVNCSNIALSGSKNLKSYWMFAGRRNVDSAIHVAAGPQLQLDCDAIPILDKHVSNIVKCDIGHVWVTRGSGDLKAKFVAHTVAPRNYDLNEKSCSELLRSCYFASLRAATVLNLKGIAIPAVGCGINEIPARISAAAFFDAMSLIKSESREQHSKNYRIIDGCIVNDKERVYFDRSSAHFVLAAADSLEENVFEVICCLPDPQTYWAWIKAAESSGHVIPA